MIEMTALFQKFISLIAAILLACGIVPSFTLERNSVIIAENIRNGLLCGDLGPYIAPDIDDCGEVLALIERDSDGDFYFGDVDYSVNISSSWRPRLHIQRLYCIAESYARQTDAEKKQELADVISSLADYWIKKDYQSVNWWYNEIAMPNLLGQISFLADGVFSAEQQNSINALIGRGCLTVNPDAKRLTGTNATDVAVASVYYGVLTKNSRAITKALGTLSSELKYSGTEGLQRDGTFFQHGKQLYIGGYGLNFISNYANALYILNGSDYSFKEKQLEPLSYFILNGLKYMSFGKTLDPAVRGRTVSRSETEPLLSAVQPLKLLSRVDNMPDRELIGAFADSIENDTKTGPGLHYFDGAEFLVINNPDFYFSFRGGRKDLYYAETLNGENILGYNTSFPGVTTVMGKGSEYTELAPVMDYAMIPGTTAVHETDEQLASHPDFTKRSLPGTYLSAVEEKAVVSAAKTSHEGVDMTVSCFATENAAVLLGAGMKNSSGEPMTTTLNQCLYAGDMRRDGNTVIHSGVKYSLLEGGEMSAAVDSRTGSFSRNNTPESKTPVTKDVFTVSVPCSGSYAYSVSGENTDADFKVIVNTEKVQAVVLPDGRVAAVFWSAGSFDFNGRTYRSLIPSAFVYR